MLDKPHLRETRTRRRKVPAIATQFLEPATALAEEEPPKVARYTLYGLSACILCGLLWASLAHIDEFVIARGQLVTTVPKLVVQPLERSSIKAIRVKAGDIVRKGQVLATLDPTFAEADVAELRAKWLSYSAQEERLTAEVEGRDYIVPAGANPSQKLEVVLFEQRRKTYLSNVRFHDEEVFRLRASAKSIRSDIKKLQERIVLLSKIVDMRQVLVNKAIIASLQLYEAKAQVVAAQRDLIQDEGKIAELGHELEGALAKRDAFVNEWREKAEDELAKTRRERTAAEEDLKKALRRRDAVTLVAPENAIVLEVAPRSIGSVLREAETLFTLVPLDAPLEAEVQVNSRDIGRVHVRNDARIKFNSYPFQSHGTAIGTVKTISADAFQPTQDNTSGQEHLNSQQRPPFYKVDVSFNKNNLRNMPENWRLLPGMTVTAEINIGSRRVISYLLYPILKGLDESMREP